MIRWLSNVNNRGVDEVIDMILNCNIEKLMKRYPDGFTPEDAVARKDKVVNPSSNDTKTKISDASILHGLYDIISACTKDSVDFSDVVYCGFFVNERQFYSSHASIADALDFVVNKYRQGIPIKLAVRTKQGRYFFPTIVVGVKETTTLEFLMQVSDKYLYLINYEIEDDRFPILGGTIIKWSGIV